MSTADPPAHTQTGRLELLLVLLVQTALQLRTLLADGVIERDPEELFSAGQGWLALHGDLGWLFAMQYRPFCGGCTVHAVTAMGLFSVLPPVEMVWKLVPLLWSLGGLGLGWVLLRRHRGAVGARLWAVVWILAPATWVHLSLIGWGNHMEAGIIVLGATLLALEGAGLGLGVLLGFGVYVSFSAGFGLVAVGGWLAARREWRRLGAVAAGLPLGLAGWGLQWALAGQHPFHTIYSENESVPDPRRLVEEWATLLAPRQLAGLFGAGDAGLGAALGPVAGGVALLVVLALLLRRQGPENPGNPESPGHPENPDSPEISGGRLIGALGASFLLVYGLTDFSVKVAETGVMYPGGLRYAAPLFVVLMLGLAWFSSDLWARGHRALALALVAPWVLSGGMGRAQVWSRPVSTARLGRIAVDWRYVRERLSYVFDEQAHRAGAQSTDPWTRALHLYGLGREGMGTDSDVEVHTDAFQEGVGERILRVQPGGALPPELATLGGGRGDGAVAAQAGLLRIWGAVDPAAWTTGLASSHPARAWVEGYAEGVRRAGDGAHVPVVVRIPDDIGNLREEAWAEGFGRGLGEVGGPAMRDRQVHGPMGWVILDGLETGIAREWWEER